MNGRSVITNIDSKTKASRRFTLRGLIFFLFYVIISYMLREHVNPVLVIPYMIFSSFCAFYLILPSVQNKSRNNLESIFIFFKKDKSVYRAFIIPERLDENMEEFYDN